MPTCELRDAVESQFELGQLSKMLHSFDRFVEVGVSQLLVVEFELSTTLRAANVLDCEGVVIAERVFHWCRLAGLPNAHRSPEQQFSG